jgi:hypothetical protein
MPDDGLFLLLAGVYWEIAMSGDSLKVVIQITFHSLAKLICFRNADCRHM